MPDRLDGGDHVIVLGHMQNAETLHEPPLTYHKREFGTHAALDGGVTARS